MAFLMRRIAVMALLAALFAPPVAAQHIVLAEQKIKAGMLYNFLKYTDWPAADAKEAMVICLYGGDPFDGNLAPLEGRSVNLRTVHVRAQDDPTAAAAQCHLIVIGDTDRWPSLRAALAGKHVLTVSDDRRFLQQGGMIAFGHDGNRILVTLNMDAVEASRLSVEQRLLKLVTVVRSGTGEGR